MAEVVITVYHDKRRGKIKDAKTVFPVKIRVYFNYKTCLYSTDVNITKEEFADSYSAPKPKGKLLEYKDKILLHLAKAKKIAQELREFSFERFEKHFLKPSSTVRDLFFYYDETIKSLEAEERIKTAKNYYNSKSSIKSFLKDRNKNPDRLSFEAITTTFLNDYERWMKSKGRESTTTGIYLRPLRAIFNQAIEAGEIEKDIYPFKKSKYQIPAGRAIKKALSSEDLAKLYNCQIPVDSLMAKAKDYWFFSYQCSGINILDIAELKYKNVTDNSIIFIRSKTKRTTKGNIKPIVISITPGITSMLEKYGNKAVSKEHYVFPILHSGMDAKERIRAVESFTRFINQHIKKVAKVAGINESLSTYAARHSYTTRAIQLGASKAFVQQQLGHQNIHTTENYFAGFEDSVRNEIDNKLMDFNNISNK